LEQPDDLHSAGERVRERQKETFADPGRLVILQLEESAHISADIGPGPGSIRTPATLPDRATAANRKEPC
jgi:hypothetical protein